MRIIVKITSIPAPEITKELFYEALEWFTVHQNLTCYPMDADEEERIRKMRPLVQELDKKSLLWRYESRVPVT